MSVDDRMTRQAADHHELTIANREHVTVSGVLQVISFDDEEIILDTDLGTLNLKGEDLHIKQLNLDDGDLAIEGVVNSVTYAASRVKGGKARAKGFLDRILR